MSSIVCPTCQQVNPAGTPYCVRCGSPLWTLGPAQVTAPAARPRMLSTLGTISLVAGICVLVIGLVVAGFVLGPPAWRTMSGHLPFGQSSTPPAPLASSSPAPSVSASASPTPVPTPTPPAGQPLATSTFSLLVPPGLEARDQTVNKATLYLPNGSDSGVLVQAQNVSGPVTVPALQQQQLASMRANYGTVTNCVPQAPLVISGISGTINGYLYIYPPAGGAAPYPVCNTFWFGTNAGGTIQYTFQEFARQATYSQLDPLATSVRSSIQWTLR